MVAPSLASCSLAGWARAGPEGGKKKHHEILIIKNSARNK
jgi:hypothetical protein